MTLPVIGITVDSESVQTHATVPLYALRKNYTHALHVAGAVPILIPHHEAHTERYVHMVDGIIFSGGHFDIPPHLYGAKNIHPTVQTKEERTSCEWQLAEQCFQAKKPILGICGGMQLINVMLGGSLIQDIRSEGGGGDHLQPPPYHLPHHDLLIKEDSILYQLYPHAKARVNSCHHQAVDRLGKGLRVTAVAPDGTVEAIEHNAQYCHGVQWHPEYSSSPFDQEIFNHFVMTCKKNV